MLMFSRQGRWLRFVLGALVVLGLSGQSFAGTVFTWETDDGTISFTDDAKRIPARYKPSATKKEMSPLKTYPRYTPAGRSHAAKETEQAQVLSGDGQTVGAQRGQATAPGFDGRAISFGGSRYGSGVRYQIPESGVTEVEAGPTVIETMRVRPENSLATRTITVVRQDGRIVAVNKAQPNQRSWAGVTATGQDEEEVLR
jgi:hypothetical protein